MYSRKRNKSIGRILIIDDDHELVDLLKDGLEYKGYHVVTAYTGELGLEAVRLFKPQLIFLDLKLPRMSGLEVIQQMIKSAIRVPVVVVTNFGYSDMAAAVRRIGVKRILHKPVDSDTIIQAIEEFI